MILYQLDYERSTRFPACKMRWPGQEVRLPCSGPDTHRQIREQDEKCPVQIFEIFDHDGLSWHFSRRYHGL